MTQTKHNMDNELDFIEIVLDKPRLIEPGVADLGSEDDLDYQNVSIRIGRRPIVKDVRKLYERSKRGMPNGYQVFKDFDIWLISHTIGVMDRNSHLLQNLKNIGYKVRFNEIDYITILDVMPKSKFITKLTAGLSVSADINLNGSFSLPDLSWKVQEEEKLQFGAGIKIGGNTEIVGRISFDIITPKIIAIGEGDYQGEWCFEKDDLPLFGMHKMTQTLLVPQGLDKLEFEVQAYANLTTFKVPNRRESEWLKLSCQLI